MLGLFFVAGGRFTYVRSLIHLEFLVGHFFKNLIFKSDKSLIMNMDADRFFSVTDGIN